MSHDRWHRGGDTLTAPSADGCCRLAVASTTTLKLAPYSGNTLWVGGQPCAIPAAGITTTSQTGLVASTLYYVYATASGGAVIALVLSTTGHITGADGREYLSSGGSTPSAVTTSRLVGMVYTNTAAAPFLDSATNRWCLNWFNRRSIATAQSANGVATASTSNTGITAGVSFLAWSDEITTVDMSGFVTSGNAGTTATTYTFLDSAGAGQQDSATIPVNSGSATVSKRYSALLVEGVHSAQVTGIVNANSATWYVDQYVNLRG